MSSEAPANGSPVKRRVKVIGLGNPLMGDDGAGVEALERLAEMDLPEEVELIDGGTGGLTLLYLIEDADRVIFLDAVAMSSPAGTVRKFDRQDLLPEGVKSTGLSLHETGLVDVLLLARQMMTSLPEIILLGIEPRSVERRIGLSDAVERGLSELIRRLLEEIFPT